MVDPPFPGGFLRKMVGPPLLFRNPIGNGGAPTFLKDSLRKSYFEKWSEVQVCHLLYGERGGARGAYVYQKVVAPPPWL